ncbi:MAG: hypothetical protein L3J41_07300 [Melioribacteraceae bacterium]|nr:hypothetical protein [Melioribacteraceae bacterium]
MAESKNFNIDFVRRTRDILESYKGEHSFSNLINCSLGLIILPYEKRRKSPVLNKNISEIDSLPFFTILDFNPIKTIIKDRISYYPKTLGVFLRKTRNGLAHQNIHPINSDGILQKILITNKYKNYTDLKVEFTENELKKFALFISELYLLEHSS